MAISKRAWKGGAIAIAVVAVLFVGGLYSGLFAAAFPKPVPAPGGGGLWAVTFDPTTDDSIDIIFTSGAVDSASVILSADQKTADAYAIESEWDDEASGNDIAFLAVVQNKNTGSIENVYAYDGMISSVSVVTDQNAGTSIPLVLKTVNNFWDLVYTGMAGVQTNDKLASSLVSQDTETVTATMEQSGAFDIFQVGATYSIVLSVAGQALTLNIHVTGA